MAATENMMNEADKTRNMKPLFFRSLKSLLYSTAGAMSLF